MTAVQDVRDAARHEVPPVIRVLVAQGKTLLRGALVVLIDGQPDFQVVAESAGGADVLAAALLAGPDVAILDHDLPNVDTWSLATQLHAALPDTRTLILTDPRRYAVLTKAIQSQVSCVGFLTKQASPRRLFSSVRNLVRGELVIDPELVVAAVTQEQNPLTSREQAVLSLVAKGVPVAEVAHRLLLSVGTVRNHLSRINVKLGARTPIEAVRRAETAGWV